MGALPKNKITRVERGKRRHGNTPKLKKDTKIARVRSHKQGFVAEFLRFLGLSPVSTQKTTGPAEITTAESKKQVADKKAQAAVKKTEPKSVSRPMAKRSIAPDHIKVRRGKK